MLKTIVKSLCLLITFWILGSYVHQAKGQEVWIRKGPVFHSNGQDTKPRGSEVTVGDDFLSSSDGDGHTNRISWSIPPATLTEGQEVVLTIESTTNPGPLLSGHVDAGDIGERNATVRDQAAGSFQGYKRGDSFNRGKLVFKFKPGPFTPTISVSVGRYDDYSGNMSMVVTWEYESR